MAGDGLKILDQKRPADIVGLSLFQTGSEGSKMGQNGQPDCLWPIWTLCVACKNSVLAELSDLT